MKRFGYLAVLAFFAYSSVYGKNAYKIGKKITTVEELKANEQATFFEIEKQQYELIESKAADEYLNYFWDKLAKRHKVSPDQARKDYMAKKVKVSDSEIAETIKQYGSHPSLKDLDKAKKEETVRTYLAGQQESEAIQEIISKAKKAGELVVMYPRPKEPVFPYEITKSDHVKYGPEAKDVEPLGCSDNCPLTVIEYSEFQCPYCSRVLPTTRKLLTNYKGRLRWIVRDFTLPGHSRAIPSAIAAHCAGKQSPDKFWKMYETLFANQRALGDEQLVGYAKKVGVNMEQYTECVNNDQAVKDLVNENTNVKGRGHGVTGTPAFIINGRKLSGALPYEKFEEIFEDELKSRKKS